MKITEGYMPFMGSQTYYRIAGDLSSDRSPLLLLHGGPGSTHNYFELLDPLAETGRAIISYDQIGCGHSYLEGRPELWTLSTWMEELKALIRHLNLSSLHLLGQSWGGMLAIAYITEIRPPEVKSCILSSTLSSSALWAREQHRMILEMSPEDQEAIRRAEKSGDYTQEDYLLANAHFMEAHCAGPVTEEQPECLRRPKRSGSESYLYGWGPNEFTPLGSLKDFDYTEALKDWTLPALIIHGSRDLCTPLVAKTMEETIPNARRICFENARHMCFAEDTPRYLSILKSWMETHDPSSTGK